MGGCLAPMNAYLNIIGMETLGLRMERICNNAYQLAQVLEKLDGVTVNYPLLESSPYHDLAQTQLNGKGGAILTIRTGSKRTCLSAHQQTEIRKDCHQHRRRPHPGHPPRLHHLHPQHPGSNGRSRRIRRQHTHQRRNRRHRRPDRRFYGSGGRTGIEEQRKYLDFLRVWLKDQDYVALVYMTGIHGNLLLAGINYDRKTKKA